MRIPNFVALVYSDLITAIPFENTVDTLDLRGDVLKDVLEYSVTASWDANKFNGKNMCHVAGTWTKKYRIFKTHSKQKLIEFSTFEGLRVVYNVTKPVKSRVVSVEVLSTDALKPIYKPLNETENYRIIVASFLVNGGDGFKMIPEHMQNHK